MFKLLPDDKEPSPSMILKTAIAMKGSMIKEHCCIQDRRIPSTKIHIWATTDGRVLVLNEVNKQFTSMESVKGSFDSVKKSYQRQLAALLRELKSKAH